MSIAPTNSVGPRCQSTMRHVRVQSYDLATGKTTLPPVSSLMLKVPAREHTAIAPADAIGVGGMKAQRRACCFCCTYGVGSYTY